MKSTSSFLVHLLAAALFLLHNTLFAEQVVPLAEPIAPIPSQVDENPEMVALGKQLFHDRRLSYNNSVACVSCHNLKNAGQNNLPVAIGVDGKKGLVNTPTVLNSGLLFRQFWNGRAQSLEEQVHGPVNTEFEMGSNWPEVITKISADDSYQQQFKKIFAGDISRQTISRAIASYERALVTPDSPFDRYLRGDKQAISQQQIHGYQLFKDYGCVSCHQGAAVGGNMYEKMGVLRDYFKDRGNLTKADYGRFNITGIEEHRFEFKVPSLRNVAMTAPYFHDGNAKTLEEAVETMAYYQLGRAIGQNDRDSIVAFLSSLTGQLDPDLLNE